MARARLARGLDHPHAVQLVAQLVRVEVVLRQRLFQRRVQVLVHVVGNEQLLLAHDLEVEAVHLAVEAADLVEHDEAAVLRRHRVVGELGREPHPALARRVGPGLGVLLVHAQPLDAHVHAARLGRRRIVGVDQRAELVGLGLGVVPIAEAVTHRGTRDQRLVACGVHQPGVPVAPVIHRVVHGGEVVHRLRPRLRNGERDLRMGAFQSGRVTDELGRHHALDRVLVDPVRKAGGAVRRVHVDAVALRVLFEQELLSIVELVGVLVHVGRSHRDQRLLGGEGVEVGRTADAVERLVAGRRRAHAAGPLGDRAVLVAGLLGAGGREGLAQLGGLGGRRRGAGMKGTER